MKTLYPYPTLFGDVVMTIDAVQIDGVEKSGRIDQDGRTIDLDGVERRTWETAAVHVSLMAPATELADFSDTRAVIVADCGSSNTRVSMVLERADSTPGMWTGVLELERSSWFGRATIRGLIVAKVEGIANRVIGNADEWTLGFDDLPRSPVTGSITIRWEDFGHPEDNTYLTQFALDPWYLRIDPENPVLFLNRGFEGLEALLNDRRRRPAAERAMHDHTRASLAAEVWMTLFNSALDAVELDEDGGIAWPAEEWQTAVLASLLTRMYEGSGRDDALIAAINARRSHDGAATLHERLLPAASQHVRLPRLLRDGIRLLGSEPVQEEE